MPGGVNWNQRASVAPVKARLDAAAPQIKSSVVFVLITAVTAPSQTPPQQSVNVPRSTGAGVRRAHPGLHREYRP